MEFATNNAIHLATEYSPFFVQSGRHPIVPTALLGKGPSNNNIEVVQEIVDRMKEALEDAKSHLAATNIHMKILVDMRILRPIGAPETHTSLEDRIPKR